LGAKYPSRAPRALNWPALACETPALHCGVMEIRQLQSFVAIARLGGFRRAVDELNISQAALSQQMKLLEAEAQVALFERGDRPLTLTEAGQALLEHAERILGEANSAREELQNFAGLERGHIKIGTLPAHGASFAVPLIGAFHEVHPNVAIDIVEYTTTELFDLLQTRAIDLACLNVPAAGWVAPPGVHFQPSNTSTWCSSSVHRTVWQKLPG
jgi:DNA-binding transcriptional LysR family regulator